MDYTREPIIETIITPKEGCKLAVRSSKGLSQEEYFVDAVEVVSFGNSSFFRSLEKPKSFLVPVSDYEILEVRETRMVLKHVGADRSIKISGGRDSGRPSRSEQRESSEDRVPDRAPRRMPAEAAPEEAAAEGEEVSTEPRAAGEEGRGGDRKRERRRHGRRRRGRDEERDGAAPAEEGAAGEEAEGQPAVEGQEVVEKKPRSERPAPVANASGSFTGVATLLPPPPMLISETIARYKENDMFKAAFYSKEEVPEGAPSMEDASAVSIAVETENGEGSHHEQEKAYTTLLADQENIANEAPCRVVNPDHPEASSQVAPGELGNDL